MARRKPAWAVVSSFSDTPERSGERDVPARLFFVFRRGMTNAIDTGKAACYNMHQMMHNARCTDKRHEIALGGGWTVERQYLFTERAHLMCPGMCFGLAALIDAPHDAERIRAAVAALEEAHPFLRAVIGHQAEDNRFFYDVTAAGKTDWTDAHEEIAGLRAVGRVYDRGRLLYRQASERRGDWRRLRWAIRFRRSFRRSARESDWPEPFA